MKTPKSILLLFALAACSPTVRLDTPEPVKIDVNMKVDVTTDEKQKIAEAKEEQQKAESNPLQSRRLRMAEIQDLKNNRIIGETNSGLLAMIKEPEDKEWGSYAKKLISEENKDRMEIFEQEAQTTGKPVDAVAKSFSKKMREAAFPGEWVQDESGQWTQH